MAKLTAYVGIFGCLLVTAFAADSFTPILSLQQGCEVAGVKCHGLPGSCANGTDTPCEVMAKVSSLSDKTVHVQLEARANQTNLRLKMDSRWIAVGFSNSGMMPDTAVVHCFRDENGTAIAKLTYNIPDGHFNIGWKTVDQSPLEVLSVEPSYDGIKCAVNLSKKFKIQNSDFDLSSAHHLLAATGPLVDGAINRHDRKPEITADTVSF
ncbi:hypothetical protein RvY_12847 [Ramazzottius varieornatus]|uniref:DOMON domain-containing protein n=1 Tax=Ramazzottius varieornatus TaxID=947166 RepID=A0A1D1VN57_RAMVA|nr:hypothetical protein RvY_12847 [Ramazzottius varieornatus]